MPDTGIQQAAVSIERDKTDAESDISVERNHTGVMTIDNEYNGLG